MSDIKQKDLDALWSSISEVCPYSSYLSENVVSADDWIDTGSMVLNALISGSLYGGIPCGRVTQFAGPSQTFKTGFVLKILANAQKRGMNVAIFDTEGAIDAASAKAAGLDVSKVMHIKTQTAENARNGAYKLLNKIKENKWDGKFIIAIDSLANLQSEMEVNRMDKESTSADMGTFAKSIKSLLKTLTVMSSLTNTPVIVTNHVYDDPSQMYPTLEKNIAGGKAAVYLPSVTVQLARKAAKDDGGKTIEDTKAASQKSFSGVIIRALTVKNRFVKQYLEGEMFLCFATGLDKYYGLSDIMKGMGVLTLNGPTYSDWKGNKLGFFKQWKHKREIWDYLIPELESRLKSEWSYSNKAGSTSHVPDEDDYEPDSDLESGELIDQ